MTLPAQRSFRFYHKVMQNALSFVCITFVVLFAITTVADVRLGADTFSPHGLLSGSRSTKKLCSIAGSSVWVTIDSKGECIRYFIAGIKDESRNTIVYFHGDQVAHFGPGRDGAMVLRSYYGANARALNEFVKLQAEHLNMAFIWVSRPGVYGSSGSHHDRRKPRESLLLNAAINAIKEHHNLTKLTLVGFSGGGHVVAALLTLRADIECAVIVSGVLDVKDRNRALGWSSDITGFTDFYDPMSFIPNIIMNDNRRIFILGSEKDQLVPFSSQMNYANAVGKQGHHVQLINVKLEGTQHHHIDNKIYEVAGRCASGASDHAILRSLD